MEYQSIAQAQAAAEYFKKFLGLSHWEIEVRFLDEETGDFDFGEVEFLNSKRMAVIHLRTRGSLERLYKSDADRCARAGKAFNQERTLLHEVLHLQLAPLEPLIKANPLADHVVEHAVHFTSVAILELLNQLRAELAKQTIPVIETVV